VPTMTSSYVFWAIVGMIAYSFTTVLVKIATRAGLPSSVVVAIAPTIVAMACWSIVVARGQSGTLLQSLFSPAGAWSLAAGAALSIAVTSLFRALELGPASVVVPIYCMFTVGGFILGVVFRVVACVGARSLKVAYRRRRPLFWLQQADADDFTRVDTTCGHPRLLRGSDCARGGRDSAST